MCRYPFRLLEFAEAFLLQVLIFAGELSSVGIVRCL